MILGRREHVASFFNNPVKRPETRICKAAMGSRRGKQFASSVTEKGAAYAGLPVRF